MMSRGKVLVYEDRHSDPEYYDISTPEKRAEAFVHLLLNHFPPIAPLNGVNADKKTRDYLAMTPEVIASLPSSIQEDIERTLSRHARDVKEHEHYKYLYDLAATVRDSSPEDRASLRPTPTSRVTTAETVCMSDFLYGDVTEAHMRQWTPQDDS